MRTFLFAFLALPLTALHAQEKQPKKEPPQKILYTVPLVVTPGEKQKLTLRGKNLDAVKEVKINSPDGVTVKVLGGKKVPVPNNYPADRIGDSEVEIELELPKTAKPGTVTIAAG